MESQLQRPVGHSYDQDPHDAVVHSVLEDEHHENKSVLKKVKDKAKKIKKKLKDGHGHEQEHEIHYSHGDPDGYDEDTAEDEDKEMVEDPEVHGAPIYESGAVKNSVPNQAQAVNLEKPTAVGEDRYDDDTKREVDKMREENVGLGLERLKAGGVPGGLQEDPHAPKSHPGEIPPPNYESKVTDSSGEGGREVDLNPVIGSFAKMGVSEETPGMESEQRGYTGSHDQFVPQGIPTEGEFSPKSPKSDMTGKSSDQSGYVQKMSAATSVIADKAISAKNAVASKLGYEGDKGQETEESKDAAGKSGASASPTEYVHKVAATVTEKLAPVYEKVAGTGSSMMSKAKGSGTGNEGAEISGGTPPDKGVSVKEFLAEKLKPSEEDKALSEVISDTLHKKKENLGKVVESKPIGKVKIEESNPTGVGVVTESEEVARHLGSGMENKRERDDAIAAGRESSGSGVVGRLKGAVSSWISKGGEQQHSKGSPDSAHVSNEGTASTGEVEHQPGGTDEHRLHESVN